MNTHGYQFNHQGWTFYVLQNSQLAQSDLDQIHKFVTTTWYPDPTAGFMTICVQNNLGQVGIYQVDHLVNLFAICPRALADINHLKPHMTGILKYLHELIKATITNATVANEIKYKIAFYAPQEIIQYVPYTEFAGNWKQNVYTFKTVCGSMLPTNCMEYSVRWSFDDTFKIKGLGISAPWNLTTNNLFQIS